jgi:hypothetical protein
MSTPPPTGGGLPWFRFFTDALDDDEIVEMGSPVFKVWVLCLCMATRHEGVVPNIDRIARRLGQDAATIAPRIKVLTDMGYMLEQDDKTYRMHDLNKRVYRSDLSTNRVNKWRENQEKIAPPPRPRGRPRKDEKDVTLHATLHATGGNGFMQHRETVSSNVTDTDTYSEIDTEADTDKKAKAATAARARDKKPTLINADFPNAEQAAAIEAWRAGKGYEQAFITAELEDFTLWARTTGTEARLKQDWVLTFYRWVGGHAKSPPPSPRATGPPQTYAAANVANGMAVLDSLTAKLGMTKGAPHESGNDDSGPKRLAHGLPEGNGDKR